MSGLGFEDVRELLTNFSYNQSLAIHNNKPSSAGEKRVKKPRKGKQNVKKLPIELETEKNDDSMYIGHSSIVNHGTMMNYLKLCLLPLLAKENKHNFVLLAIQ